jgi:hypothetical protein
VNVKGQYSPNPAFLAFVTVSGSLIAQDQAADQSIAALAPPYKTVTFSYLRPKRATIPFLSHGYLIQVKHFTIAAGGSVTTSGGVGPIETLPGVWRLRTSNT